jgi:SPP1 gp7 family putative phage head morphogenesis protein
MPRAPRKDTAALRRRVIASKRAEEQFARALRRVAKKCGDLARKTFASGKPMGSSMKLRAALESYGQQLTPWARATAARMVADVARRDEKFWADQSKLMSRAFRAEIRKTPLGPELRERTAEAAELITSLPLEAALRVEALTIEYMTQGVRAKQLARDIMRTGQVTISRANTIARTETSRTAGIVQETRAKSVGSEGYVWRTAGDILVRELHEDLEGKYFRWDSPPIIGTRGERGHPGSIYNCRCWAEIVLPGEKMPGRKRVMGGASRFTAEPVELFQ